MLLYQTAVQHQSAIDSFSFSVWACESLILCSMTKNPIRLHFVVPSSAHSLADEYLLHL